MDEVREHDVVAVPPGGTLTGLLAQLVKVTPEGAELAVIVTEPLKPWRLVTATWVEPDAPELKSTGLVAEMLKPDTNVKVAVVE